MIERFEVPVEQPVPGGATNTYLLGDPPVLIDPADGPAAIDIDPARVEHIAVTHTHPDHTGGVKQFRKASGAVVWASASHRVQFRERTGIEPDRTFGEGDKLAETGVRVMACPGHCPDHVAFLFEGHALIGDIARQDGSVMVGVPDGDMRAYLTSLRRLRTRNLDTAHPGHGPPIAAPTERFEALLAHRRQRERRVEAAVTEGCGTVSEVVDAAYDKDLTGVETAAARTVRAHLEKLAVEGRVSWDGSMARPA